ncbi:hypothetical protein HGRIS_009713 [Hohenbuehelia grisea]|uniref:uracil phosphoribosyltransferase n=1 Tax=Hohenbuehelia grisea TaxID=104357 RepID=A0ABR3J3G4_9AGAR
MSNNLHILDHPLVGVAISRLRSKESSSQVFRETIAHLSLALGYEATRDAAVASFQGETPVSAFEGTKIDSRIGLAPILRAGIGMTDPLLTIFPNAKVYHLGLFREKVSLQPVEYYSKLPTVPTVDQVFILDPMIATGGTAVAAMQMIVDWGIPVKNIKLLSVLASEEGLKHVQESYPELEIWVAAVDKTLTAEGLIQPGLGDAGDRIFNTVRDH